MFKRTKLSASLLVAFGGVLGTPAVMAQQQTSQLERIEITGSSIRRIEGEGALPVQVIKREDITKSGATSVVDLLQKLPGIQGGTTEAASVGGGGGGFSGISVHNLGETRTLVLLNGRRISNYGGQALTGFGAAVDLNTIPIAAIERVEILTDGASALYGSDAIAGVVNFITRRNSTVGDVSVGYSRPKGGVANEKRASLTKGFGDLDSDGWNVMFAGAYDKRDPMDAPDRDFSRSGVVNFGVGGQRYQAFLGSPSAIPANATDDADDFINPYFLANGSCAPGNVPVVANGKTACYFDFVRALEIYPERERYSGLLNGSLKLGNDHTLFANTMYSKTESTGRIAPVPGQVSIDAGTPLHTQYLAPFGVTGDSTAFYRASDLGLRGDLNENKFYNVVLGLEGVLGSWDYKTAVTQSQSDYRNAISGYPGALAFRRLLSSGLLNPFVGPGEQTPDALAAINAASFNGYWDGGKTKLQTWDLSGSRPLFDLKGGPAAIGVGVNYYKEDFKGLPSPFAQGILADPVLGTPCDPTITDPDTPGACDTRFGDEAGIIPYSAQRKVWGVFAEFVAPVLKSLELTAAVRYDNYDDVGTTTNGKASFRWTPTQGFLVRGSVGTGFHAPTVPQLRAAPQPFGVTSAQYRCNAASADPAEQQLAAIAAGLGAQCRPGTQQYDIIAGGNSTLEPETSRQASLGFVFEPTPSISVGADLWYVKIEDSFGQITEDEAFANPATYATAWTIKRDTGTGIDYIAYNQSNLNLGKEYSTGIDFDISGRTNTDFGRLSARAIATYMLREDQQLIPNGPYYSAIGNNNESLGEVTFRWQGRLITNLTTGNWSHTLQTNFKSGYKDAAATVIVLGPGDVVTDETADINLRIKRYVTFDWQTQWQATKAFSLTAGVLNLFDNEPPLSLAQGGNGKGQMFGYDDRYYDARGRTLYVNASYAF